MSYDETVHAVINYRSSCPSEPNMKERVDMVDRVPHLNDYTTAAAVDFFDNVFHPRNQYLNAWWVGVHHFEHVVLIGGGIPLRNLQHLFHMPNLLSRILQDNLPSLQIPIAAICTVYACSMANSVLYLEREKTLGYRLVKFLFRSTAILFLTVIEKSLLPLDVGSVDRVEFSPLFSSKRFDLLRESFAHKGFPEAPEHLQKM